MPVRLLGPHLHAEGPTRVEFFDLSGELGAPSPCTSPNLLAGFVRICAHQSQAMRVCATSSMFFCLRGAGETSWANEVVTWKQGDLFVVPGTATFWHDAIEDAALYFVTDEALLSYLGVRPCTHTFAATLFPAELLRASVEDIAREGHTHRNRLDVLLATERTEATTRTLTRTLWCLLNLLPAGRTQPPHRHNSVALDLVVSAPASGCYTLLGPSLTADGTVGDPVRVDWVSGAVFTTPPGWWHSHHNDSGQDAWVLPVQDAGLFTHQRVLGLDFVPCSVTPGC